MTSIWFEEVNLEIKTVAYEDYFLNQVFVSTHLALLAQMEYLLLIEYSWIQREILVDSQNSEAGQLIFKK